MAENGNLGKFEAVLNNGTAFAPKQCLYQNVAVGMEIPKMESLSRFNKRTGQITQIHAPRIGPRMETWEFSKLSKTMVPPLHQGNVYIKMQLWVWRSQKYNRFLGAINSLQVTARQITRFHAPCIKPRMEIWENSKLSKTMVPPLHQSSVYIKM